MEFLFSSAVDEVGFYLNYAPGIGNDPTISTLDQYGVIISSFNLATLAPISTPSAFNQFEFRGIDEEQDIIYGFRLGGSYILAAATSNGDPGGDPVPEPATMLLFGTGIAGLAAAGRRKRN